MGIKFKKMSGAGNDFIVLDNREGVVGEDPAGFARAHCPRRTAVGADGVLLIEDSDEADFRMCILNPDGSEAEMCGNGARCAARFAVEMGIAPSALTMETLAGPVSARVAGETVTIGMGGISDIREAVSLDALGRSWTAHPVTAGVPHAIIFVEDLEAAPVEPVGREIRNLELFQPGGTNVDFVRPAGAGRIEIRTYERGVEAETLACGTGAIASAVVSHLAGRVGDPPIEVRTPGGLLTIDFRGRGGRAVDVTLTGDARFIYAGTLP
ncbi:MAG: diaminopimelate epimerase [Planctomycetes bacterium]|nr:diaminopimelate epimerase [Planctomycetota bacterium]